MKLIIQVDPETGEVEGFLWDRLGKPPPLIRPKIKKKKGGKSERKKKVS